MGYKQLYTRPPTGLRTKRPDNRRRVNGQQLSEDIIAIVVEVEVWIAAGRLVLEVGIDVYASIDPLLLYSMGTRKNEVPGCTLFANRKWRGGQYVGEMKNTDWMRLHVSHSSGGGIKQSSKDGLFIPILAWTS